jgi:hypothetical protein
VEAVPAGSPIWRAQRSHRWRKEEIGEGLYEELPFQYCPQRMKPRANRALEGRSNPKGIPYLYVATEQETAIAEVRPWVGALVSAAHLESTRELRLLNCTSDDHRTMIYFAEPDAPERERAVWKDIDRAFSRPVSVQDDTADYAPTQILAELFR